MRTIPNLILASKSPRRQALLEQIGISGFAVIPSETEERPDEKDPSEYVMFLAQSKAQNVAKRVGKEDIVLSADTIVWLDGEILEKPADAKEALNMLKKLSGKAHTVYTGVTVMRGDKAQSFVEQAKVFFREIGNRELAEYIATGEPFDKAGAYGVQGIGARFVTRIEGDYSCVVGLPLSRTYLMLKDFGLFG